jgi:S-formylglutathione hydrolase FrmB
MATIETHLQTMEVASARLGADVRVVVGSASEGNGCPAGAGGAVTWLLHGRSAGQDEVRDVVSGLLAAMSDGALPPRTVIAPCDPHPDASSWWVDAPSPGGRPVETALLGEVFPEMERRTGGPRTRDERVVAGYSMGGGGALRWLLVHPGLFSAAALVSPAAFEVPPLGSSVETSGVFATASSPYSAARWAALLSYPRLLASLETRAELRVGIVVGDREPLETYPFGRSSLALESARLHVALSDKPGVTSALRIVAAAHTADFWAPGLTLAHALVG